MSDLGLDLLYLFLGCKHRTMEVSGDWMVCVRCGYRRKLTKLSDWPAWKLVGVLPPEIGVG